MRSPPLFFVFYPAIGERVPGASNPSIQNLKCNWRQTGSAATERDLERRTLAGVEPSFIKEKRHELQRKVQLICVLRSGSIALLHELLVGATAPYQKPEASQDRPNQHGRWLGNRFFAGTASRNLEMEANFGKILVAQPRLNYGLQLKVKNRTPNTGS